MKKKKVTLHIGSLNDMGQRFANAWRKAERGEKMDVEHVTFPDLSSLLSALSPKRLDLLKILRAAGPCSVRALSEKSGRDYKSVHQDVSHLIAAGLIERRARDSVAVTWTKVSAEVDLEAA